MRTRDSLRFLGYVQLAMGSLAIATLPVYLASFDWMVDAHGGVREDAAGLHAVQPRALRDCVSP